MNALSVDKDVLGLFDRVVRRRLEPIDPSWRVESADEAIRAIGPTPSPLDNSLCWAQIDAANADEIIREQIGFFRGLGRDFMWKVYSHDAPGDLEERLVRFGFELLERVKLAVLETSRAPSPVELPPGVRLEEVAEPSGLEPLIEVQRTVWERDYGWLLAALSEEMTARPERLNVFVGWAEAAPVCSGWVRFASGSPFGSLWGGSVRPEFRHKGLYRAMLAAPTEVARRRNVPYVC